MKTGFVWCRIALVGLVMGGFSLSSLAKDDYSAPVSFQKDISTYTVKKDGSYEVTSERSMLIENEERDVARFLGQEQAFFRILNREDAARLRA